MRRNRLWIVLVLVAVLLCGCSTEKTPVEAVYTLGMEIQAEEVRGIELEFSQEQKPMGLVGCSNADNSLLYKGEIMDFVLDKRNIPLLTENMVYTAVFTVIDSASVRHAVEGSFTLHLTQGREEICLTGDLEKGYTITESAH